MDALEPRVLLNADTLAVQLASMPQDVHAHDILIQMVQETATAGTKAQALQLHLPTRSTQQRPVARPPEKQGWI